MVFKYDENNIAYLHEYYPKRYKEHSGESENILQFKNGDSSAIEKYRKEISEALADQVHGEVYKLKGYFVAVVPSHQVGRHSIALLNVVEYLRNQFEMINANNLLIRKRNHDKLSYGGDRSVASHIDTIVVNSNIDIFGKNIIILDDITTTGNSMLASSKLIGEHNVNSIIKVTIGKTTSGTEL